MKLSTLHFGEIEVAKEDIITFPNGIPGFEQLRTFTIVRVEEHLPFYYLQSLEETVLSFIITNPFLVYPEYDFTLPAADQGEIDAREDGELAVWSIVTIRDNVETATLNLLAPLVINMEKRLGKQVVLHDSPYKTKHPLVRDDSASGEPSEAQTKEEHPC